MTRGHARRRVHARGGSGQALVEFALVVPIFLLLLYGIVEFGRYVYFAQALNNAAREGARYAIVHGESSFCPSGPVLDPTRACDIPGNNVKAAVRSYSVGIDPASISFPTLDSSPQSAWPQGSGCRGCTVTISVSMPFRTIIPIVPLPNLTVTGSATLVVNH